MRNNSISSVYLSKCDLLHKLAIKNIHKSPKIEKLSFQFLLKNTKLNVSSNVEMNNQIKGILLLYTFLPQAILCHSNQKLLKHNPDDCQ